MGLLFGAEADAQLSALEADAAAATLLERINRALDVIERDPDSAGARARAYRVDGEIVWGVVVRGPHDDWLVMWEPVEVDQIVHYIGRDL